MQLFADPLRLFPILAYSHLLNIRYRISIVISSFSSFFENINLVVDNFLMPLYLKVMEIRFAIFPFDRLLLPRCSSSIVSIDGLFCSNSHRLLNLFNYSVLDS